MSQKQTYLQVVDMQIQIKGELKGYSRPNKTQLPNEKATNKKGR